MARPQRRWREQIRRSSQGAVANLRSVRGFAPRIVRFQNHRHRARGNSAHVSPTCPDSQRAWLALEDYFEKLSLSRRDFPDTDWWPRTAGRPGQGRLEELAFLFLRAKRSVPPELQPHASLDRFARAEEAEQELQARPGTGKLALAARAPLLDTPRATLRVVCQTQPDEEEPSRHRLAVQFLLLRPRTGEKARTLHDMIDLVVRAAHEQELFHARRLGIHPVDCRHAPRPRRRRGHAGSGRRRTASMARALGPDAAPRIATASRCISTARSPRYAASGKRRQGAFVHAPAHACRTARTIPWPTCRFFNRQPPLALVGGTILPAAQRAAAAAC